MTNGHVTAWAGPWGVSYAANLTPDKRTGIGAWTADQFIKTMRTGKHLGVGRPVLPPMPVEAVAARKPGPAAKSAQVAITRVAIEQRVA